MALMEKDRAAFMKVATWKMFALIADFQLLVGNVLYNS